MTVELAIPLQLYSTLLLYRADPSARYGKYRLYYMRVLYINRICTQLLDSRKV